MPELPDVEIYKRYADATSLHQTIAEIRVTGRRMLEHLSPEALNRKAGNRKLTETHRHGKYLFLRVGARGWLVLHFGMTGYLEYAKKKEPPQHTRLCLNFSNGAHMAYVAQRMLGRIAWTDSPAAYVRSHAIAPDALRDFRSPETFAGLFVNRRGSVKSLLMNQRHIAGIGNVYADEILFQAGIRPDRKAAGLSDREIANLHKFMLHVLETAIERKADPLAVPGNWLLPHRAEGEACPRCGKKVEKIKSGGRAGLVCPGCQS